MPEDEYLTATEIADIYKVSRFTVDRWAREGLIPVAVLTPGGQRRFRLADVEEALSPKAAS
jgi:excisionase family DNA binding protein